MAPDGITRIEVLRSRFEIDLNRPRFRAVYQGPDDAWGLPLYNDDLPDRIDRVSRAVHDAFYAQAHAILSQVAQVYGRFVVLDLHSYNHRRGGAEAPAAPVAENPEVNLGTGRLNRLRIEFKKTYMDEWSGEADDAAIERIRATLEATVPALTSALDRLA